MKKVLSILLALTLLCSLAAPALATDRENSSPEASVASGTNVGTVGGEATVESGETGGADIEETLKEENEKTAEPLSEKGVDGVCYLDTSASRHSSIEDALSKISTDTNVHVIVLTGDSVKPAKAITIAENQNVTINLNGKVLDLTTFGITVKRGGTLTIEDTSTSPATNYFKADSTGKWISGTSTDIAVTGGVIIGATTGAIVNEGTLTVSGGNFVGNTSGTTATNGGAIRSTGTLKIAGGTFKGNTASGNGGAIAVTAGTAEITGGTFENNTASGNGGALYIATDKGAAAATAVTVFGTTAVTFTNNAALGSGGAIYACTETADTGATAPPLTTLTATNAKITFTKNTSAKDGGAIASGNAALVLVGSAFNGNTATGNGGAIAIANAKTTNADLSKLTINECSAQNGGGIAITGGTVTVTGGTITRCSAKSCGGGIYLYDSGVVANSASTATATAAAVTAVTLSGCTIGGTSTTVGNYAVTSGGGVYNYGVLNLTGALVITNNYLSSSSAYTTSTVLDPTKLLEQLKVSGDNLNNLYCNKNVAAAVSGAATGMNIGVSTATAPVKGTSVIAFATGVSTDAGFFASDVDSQYVSAATSAGVNYLVLCAKYSVAMNTTVPTDTMAVSTDTAAPGEKVYITLKSNATYKIANVSVLKTDSTAVTLSQDNSGVYFVMPEGDVVIAVDTTKTTASAEKIVAAKTADTWRIIFYVTLLSASVGGVAYMMYRRLRPYRDL